MKQWGQKRGGSVATMLAKGGLVCGSECVDIFEMFFIVWMIELIGCSVSTGNRYLFFDKTEKHFFAFALLYDSRQLWCNDCWTECAISVAIVVQCLSLSSPTSQSLMTRVVRTNRLQLNQYGLHFFNTIKHLIHHFLNCFSTETRIKQQICCRPIRLVSNDNHLYRIFNRMRTQWQTTITSVGHEIRH